MSKRPKDHKPYVDEVSHYEKAHRVDKSGLHTRGGNKPQPDEHTGRELDELYNHNEINRQRDMSKDE